MPYVLNANAVSEAIEPRPDARVVSWLAAQPSAAVYLLVLTLGEIEQGIVRSQHPRRSERLRRWLDDEFAPRFGGRIYRSMQR